MKVMLPHTLSKTEFIYSAFFTPNFFPLLYFFFMTSFSSLQTFTFLFSICLIISFAVTVSVISIACGMIGQTAARASALFFPPATIIIFRLYSKRYNVNQITIFLSSHDRIHHTADYSFVPLVWQPKPNRSGIF